MKLFILFITMFFMLFFISCNDDGGDSLCSADNPNGKCENADEYCKAGICLKKAKKCDPVCTENQICLDGVCEDTSKEVDCTDVAPDNATSVAVKVTVNYDVNKKEWEAPVDCEWECNDEYKKNSYGTGCIKKTEDDYCKDVQCGEHAFCKVENKQGICACESGYKLNDDNISCSDIDECTVNNGGCNQNCTNTDGGFECSCNTGFTLGLDGKTCSDINECASDNGGCDINAVCNNKAGSFECLCKSGFTGNGQTCSVIEICKPENNPCTENHKTFCKDENHDGIAECLCDIGYKLNEQTGECENINECDPNHLLANCNSEAACHDIEGGYECICNDGYEGDGLVCNDIDECATNTDNCSDNATCINKAGNDGKFECTCNSGFTGDGVTCSDIDECSDASLNNCDSNATCTNNDGGFSCACNSGYSGDGVTCNDIDECSDASLNNCDSNATCTNNDGGFSCACNSGYSGDGVTCNDIDECSDDTDTCIDGEYCKNTSPDYNCIACNCTTANTNGNTDTCTDETGQCDCDYKHTGLTCDDCADGFMDIAGECKSAVVINEVDPNNDWIELYNNSNNYIVMSNWEIESLSDGPFVINGTISAHSYYIINGFDTDSGAGELAELRDANGNILDSTTLGVDISAERSWGRFPNGLGAFNDLGVITGNSKNEITDAIGWCGTTSPDSMTATAGNPTNIVYGDIWIDGITDDSNGMDSHMIRAQLCYTDDLVNLTNPVCVDAVYWAENGNNDQFAMDLTIPVSNTYKYYYQFSTDNGATWTTCNLQSEGGSNTPTEASKVGDLTVNP